MKNHAIITLEDVWKIYQIGDIRVNAVQGVDLYLSEGEFVAIMGASGSGKSTMMNLIGCLDIPTKGKIFLMGKNIAQMPSSGLASLRGRLIGFIFQQFNLIPTLSAMANVALPMMFQGVPSEQRNARAAQLLAMIGLSDRMHHKPTELSGGQQQRVAIARALANDPKIILADEPTGNLDSTTGHKVIDFLKDLHRKEKKTILMVTHDERLAKEAQRIIYLKDGKIIKRS